LVTEPLTGFDLSNEALPAILERLKEAAFNVAKCEASISALHRAGEAQKQLKEQWTTKLSQAKVDLARVL
jgi:hypothetical protein